MDMAKTVFLTGATGFVGANLAVKILTEETNATLIALVRGETPTAARERFWKTIATVDPSAVNPDYERRVTVMIGDVSMSRLGLSDEDYGTVSSTVTHIIHSAASVDFQHPLEEARHINCGGTRNMLELARTAHANGTLCVFGHVSTAYVSGLRSGTIREDELDHENGFSNSYEQSKFEAEQLVNDHKTSLPIVILRPSIVVGDSVTGVTTAFNVLYVPLKYIFHGYVPCLPGSSRTRLDVVPVDYVRDAAYHILFRAQGAIGHTFHLTAGQGGISTTGDIVRRSVGVYNMFTSGRQITAPPFIPKRAFDTALRFMRGGAIAAKALSIYESYLSRDRMYDTSNTVVALRGTNIAAPRFESYCETILGYFLHATSARRKLKAA
jgi:long-chain acyl-CoA synthetase